MKAAVGAGVGALASVGGALAGWPAVAVLALLVAPVPVLLVWVLSDGGRTQHMVALIWAARAPTGQPVPAPPGAPGVGHAPEPEPVAIPNHVLQQLQNEAGSEPRPVGGPPLL